MNRHERRAFKAKTKDSQTLATHFETTKKILEDIDLRLGKLEGRATDLEQALEMMFKEPETQENDNG